MSSVPIFSMSTNWTVIVNILLLGASDRLMLQIFSETDMLSHESSKLLHFLYQAILFTIYDEHFMGYSIEN